MKAMSTICITAKTMYPTRVSVRLRNISKGSSKEEIVPPATRRQIAIARAPRMRAVRVRAREGAV